MEPISEPDKPQPKALTSWPNVLLLVLYLINVAAMLPKYGLSIATFARSLGICIIPLILGIAWNLTRGDNKALKWTFVSLTLLFVLIFVGAQLQIASEHGN